LYQIWGFGSYGIRHECRKECAAIGFTLQEQLSLYLGGTMHHKFTQEGQIVKGPIREYSFIHIIIIILIVIIIIIISSSSSSISSSSTVWQEPEPSQATGMALARCISRQVLMGSLPMPSTAFRRSHFCC
jgi:hypothetical protein